MLFASIIVDISVKQLDRPFTYIIPDKLKDIEEGTCVRVPFGRGNRLIEGYVIDIMDETTYDTSKDNFKLKEIHSIVKDKVKVEERLIKTAAFIRKTTGSTMNAAMKVVMPVKMNVKFKEEKILSCDISSDTFKDAYATAVRRKYSAQLKVFNAINSESKILDFKKGVNYKSFREKYDLANSTLKALSDKGVIRLESYNVLRNPYENLEREDNNILLNDEQNEVKDSILEEYDRGDLRPALIHGVTGSGKTAVYIELIKEMINRGKTAILLIPEIALTLQNLKRFNNEFGDKCSVIHSKLSHGERFDRFEAVKRGEIKVMIGPRSALFTPFQNIGIIIIDEEHETGYRSETTPKYHAIEVAEYIAKTENAKLVLGSATPSVKSYRNAVDGKYTYHSLMKRAFSSAVLPRVQVVDMREELKNYNRSIFSNELKRLMNEKLAKGEQIMLFINR
nr:primosomal protein N' [Lachnospiraceae bacterium]